MGFPAFTPVRPRPAANHSRHSVAAGRHRKEALNDDQDVENVVFGKRMEG